MNKIEKKREKEKYVVEKMIRIYCHGHHKTSKNKVCEDCQKLIEYAHMRSDRCPFMENKTFCINCKVHCYQPKMREKIREVMRYSGPRMIFHHPILALWHVICSKREKKKMEEEF